MELDTQINRFIQLSISASSLAVVLSVAHEIGYFSIVGHRFITVLSIADFVRLGLLWIPYTLSFVIISYYIMYLQERYREALNISSSNKTYSSGIWIIAVHILAIICMASISVHFSYARPLNDFILSSVYSVVLLAQTIFIVVIFRIQVRRVQDVFVYSLPLALCYSLLFGIWNATNDLERVVGSYVETNDLSTQSYSKWILLKAVENGVIVSRIGYRDISFYRWETVARISQIESDCLSFRSTPDLSFIERYILQKPTSVACRLDRDVTIFKPH